MIRLGVGRHGVTAGGISMQIGDVNIIVAALKVMIAGRGAVTHTLVKNIAKAQHGVLSGAIGTIMVIMPGKIHLTTNGNKLPC